MRRVLGLVDITSDKSPRAMSLERDSVNVTRPWGRMLKRQAPTVPFTIGLNAIKGSSAVPVPSALFKLGAGYNAGKAVMAFDPCSAM
jgi:hypothetical protein